MATTQQPHEIYLNHTQQKILHAGAKDTRVVAGRRFGKTDGVMAPWIWTTSDSMPGMTGGWMAVSRSQAYSKTIPGTLAALERMFGFQQGIHMGWGRPPKHVAKSILEPKTYDNIIWFANGSLWAVISLAQIAAANSYTFSATAGDEMRFIDKRKIDDSVQPANSGQTHPLGDRRFTDYNPRYRGSMWVSDASLTVKGNWLEREEDKLDMVIEDDTFQQCDSVRRVARQSGIKQGQITYRWVQEQLEQYAERVIRYNNMLYKARTTGHRVHVVDRETRAVIRAVARQMMMHEGMFKIMPNYGKKINKAMVDMAVNYKLVTQDDAELLYDHEFLITTEEDFEMQMFIKSKKFNEGFLRELRRVGFCCFRASTLDNVDILTEQYIAQMKRDLPMATFAVSILNQKLTKSNDGFYSNLDIDHVHGYVPDTIDPLSSAKFSTVKSSGVIGGQRITAESYVPDFNELDQRNDCSLDGDVVDELPLYIALDYNANINTLVVGQMYPRDGMECLNVIKSFYVKNERKLRELISDFSRYYAPKRAKNRDVTYFYDSTAKQGASYATTDERFYMTAIQELEHHGWRVQGVDMGVPEKHEIKHKIINDALAHITTPAIRINQINNPDLIIALQLCEVQMGYKGFRKDKSQEKKPESDTTLPLQQRSDFTDAFDSLFLGVKLHRGGGFVACMPSGRRRRKR